METPQGRAALKRLPGERSLLRTIARLILSDIAEAGAAGVDPGTTADALELAGSDPVLELRRIEAALQGWAT